MNNDSPKIERLEALVRKLQVDTTERGADLARLDRTVKNIGSKVSTLQSSQMDTPPAPVANLIYNGELGHSVNSWYDSAYVVTDSAKECAWFWSHDAPVAAQTLDETDARTSSANKTLKASSHSTYDAHYGLWDSVRGEGKFQGTKSIDARLPANYIDATIKNFYVFFILARRTAYMSIPSGFRMGAGIWDNTAGQRDWLTGDVGLEANATIDGATTVSRKYRLFVQTDRGYTILSNEVTINAPDDGQYNANNFVTLTWRSVAGYLQVRVIEYTPSTGVYRLLEEVSGPSAYVDNGSFRSILSGYPSATDTNRKAVFYSSSGNLDTLGVDGVAWQTFLAIIGIPDNYNRSLTTDKQWLRIFCTAAVDLYITEITTDGTTTINFPAAIFETDYAALYPGLQILFYDADGNLIKDTTIASRTDADTIVVASAPAAGSARSVRVVGGGFHGILFDKVHAGYQRNVSFAPNPNDVRTLQPVAAPNGSSQGGTGDGGEGSGDRGGLCVTIDTPIASVVAPFEYGDVPMGGKDDGIQKGYHLKGENSRPNTVIEKESWEAPTRYVELENGCWKRCTEDHRFRVDIWDTEGVPLRELHVGTRVMANVDGVDELSPIAIIGPLTEKRRVGHVRLRGGHYYLAGRWRARKPWQKILIALKLMKPKNGKIYAHNRKNDLEFGF